MKTAYLVITIIRGEARLLSIFSSLDLTKGSADEIHVRPVNHEYFDSSAEEYGDAVAELRRKCGEQAWLYPGTFGKALKQLAEPHVSGVPWPVPEHCNELAPSAERNLRRISRAFDLLAAAHLAKGWRRRRKRRELLAALPHLGGEDIGYPRAARVTGLAFAGDTLEKIDAARDSWWPR